jgi:hypothetical protein
MLSVVVGEGASKPLREMREAVTTTISVPASAAFVLLCPIADPTLVAKTMLVQSTLRAPTREKMDIELPFLVDHRRASLFDIPRFTGRFFYFNNVALYFVDNYPSVK